MQPEQRVVTVLPLHELWDASGPVAAERGPAIGAEDVASLLRLGPVQFVVADMGPLRWVSPEATFRFWKEEVKPRVVPAGAEQFRLEDYPGNYCYVATRWERQGSSIPVVLLERHH